MPGMQRKPLVSKSQSLPAVRRGAGLWKADRLPLRGVTAREKVLRELLDEAHARIRMLEKALAKFKGDL